MPEGNPGDLYYCASFPTGFDLGENCGLQLFSLWMKLVIKISYYHWILEQLPSPAQPSRQSCLFQYHCCGCLVYAQISPCPEAHCPSGSLSHWKIVLITRLSFSQNLLLSLEQHTINASCHLKGLQMSEIYYHFLLNFSF